MEYPTLSGVVRAVDGVTLDVYEGEWLSIVGESGCGKSTLALSILRLLPPPGRIAGGSIVYRGSMDLARMSERSMRRVRGREIAMIFQDPMTSLDPLRTVGDQIADGLIEHGLAGSRGEALEMAASSLERVGLPRDRVKYYPHQLSGGQRQRALIAAAIALRPKLLIADEPTTALDVVVQDKIMRLLEGLRRDYGMTIVLITHDIALAYETSDRIAVMYAGKLAEVGPAEDVVRDPKHPYTRALVSSVPDVWARRKIQSIPGYPPDLRSPPPGCRFHPRCPLADSRCSREEPGPVAIGSRKVYCHYAG